jgi:tRNA (Thr-GGU) A37 N-methylase
VVADDHEVVPHTLTSRTAVGVFASPPKFRPEMVTDEAELVTMFCHVLTPDAEGASKV